VTGQRPSTASSAPDIFRPGSYCCPRISQNMKFNLFNALATCKNSGRPDFPAKLAPFFARHLNPRRR
jgi:hypothetical protein